MDRTRSLADHVVAAILSTLLSWLIASGLIGVFPGEPYLAVMIAGIAAAIAFESGATIFAAGAGTFLALLMLLGRQVPWMADWMLIGLPGLACLSALGAVFARRFAAGATIAFVLLAVIVGGFGYQSRLVAPPAAQKFAVEPADEGYAFDPVFFAKVYYLVDRGVPYYQAYGDGFVKDARFDKPTQDLAGWRSPTTFWLWSAIFPNGAWMVWTFVGLAMLSMVLGFDIGRRLASPGFALAAPALMFPYYLYAVPSSWFFELEFWAGFVALGAAALAVSRRRWVALPLALLAGAMREWLISAPIAGLVSELRQRKWKEALAWAGAVAAIVAIYLVNMRYVAAYLRSVGVTPALGAGGRAGNGGVDFILYTLQFCAQFLAHPTIVPYTVFALALVVAAYLIKEGEEYVPLLFLLPLVAFLVFGSGEGPGGDPGLNDYYNAAFMPFAFVLAGMASRLAELVPGTQAHAHALSRRSPSDESGAKSRHR